MLQSAIFLTLAILFNTLAMTLFKFSSLNESAKVLSFILLLVGLAMGGVNAVTYTFSLKNIPQSLAYTLFSAGSIILVTILSVILFKETMTMQKIIGMGVICVGIFLVTR
jgi:spermidine export protein MdtJ